MVMLKNGVILTMGLAMLGLIGCSTAQQQAAADQAACAQTTSVQCVSAAQAAGKLDAKVAEQCAIQAALSCIAQHPIPVTMPSASN